LARGRGTGGRVEDQRRATEGIEPIAFETVAARFCRFPVVFGDEGVIAEAVFLESWLGACREVDLERSEGDIAGGRLAKSMMM